MRVLLDECVPARLERALTGHAVSTVPREGWAGIGNGLLLAEIDQSQRFDVFVTVDKRLPVQQSIAALSFGLVVLRTASNSIDDLLPLVPNLQVLLCDIQPGKVEVLGG